MNKKEKIRIIRLLLKQYEKDKNILNSLNQANLYPSINYEDYYLKKIIYFIEYN